MEGNKKSQTKSDEIFLSMSILPNSEMNSPFRIPGNYTNLLSWTIEPKLKIYTIDNSSLKITEIAKSK